MIKISPLLLFIGCCLQLATGFQGHDNIVVTTGFIEGDGLVNAKTSEVIDILEFDKTCKNLESAPTQRWAAVGGVLKGRPLICGGFNGTHSFKDCFYISGDQVNNQPSMSQIRSFATSLVLKDPATNEEYMWVVGGFEDVDLSSTEFVYTDKPAKAGPKLDFVVAHHCMVQTADDAVYIVAGKQEGAMTNKVWIVDPTNNFQVKEGPSLKADRYFHSCAAMKDEETGAVKIVVAGGFGSHGPTASVEILDTSSADNTWVAGPSLPSANLFAGQMLTEPGQHATAVLAVADTSLLSLSSGATEWSASVKTIQYGRMMPVVLAVPDKITSCGFGRQ